MEHIETVLQFFQKDMPISVFGANSEKEYGWLLKSIYEEAQKQDIHIYIDEFKFPSNIQVITAIQNGLKTMNLNQLAQEEIVLTQNVLLNKKIHSALVKYLQPALCKCSEISAKENFFVKHIVWLYERLEQHRFKTDAKLIYFGRVDEDTLLHINMLNAIGYFVLCLSPSQSAIKIDGCQEIAYSSTMHNVSFMELMARGEKPINNVVETSAKRATREIEELLYGGDIVIKPWQYRQGSTQHLHLNAVMEDIWTYWNQDARFREGFKIENDVVFVPSFAIELHGIYSDDDKMRDFLKLIVNSGLTHVEKSTNILQPSYTDSEMYSLAFALSQQGISFAKLQQNALYSLNSTNMDVQMFIFKKLNNFYLEKMQETKQVDLLRLIANVITMPTHYLRLVESFDFPFKVPKIVLYIQERVQLTTENCLFLKFLNYLGFDVLILSPGGVEVCHDFYDLLLDEFRTDYSLETALLHEKKTKRSFWKKMFDK